MGVKTNKQTNKQKIQQAEKQKMGGRGTRDGRDEDRLEIIASKRGSRMESKETTYK